jgi:DNA damage-binding protein 2
MNVCMWWAGKHVEEQVGQLGVLPHTKVVNSAYFSPHTGQKLLTTCIDNRIRIWDYLAGRPE